MELRVERGCLADMFLKYNKNQIKFIWLPALTTHYIGVYIYNQHLDVP